MTINVNDNNRWPIEFDAYLEVSTSTLYSVTKKIKKRIIKKKKNKPTKNTKTFYTTIHRYFTFSRHYYLLITTYYCNYYFHDHYYHCYLLLRSLLSSPPPPFFTLSSTSLSTRCVHLVSRNIIFLFGLIDGHNRTNILLKRDETIWPKQQPDRKHPVYGFDVNNLDEPYDTFIEFTFLYIVDSTTSYSVCLFVSFYFTIVFFLFLFSLLSFLFLHIHVYIPWNS